MNVFKRVVEKTITKKLDSFIYLTTFRCNGSCSFCCFKNSINKKFDELSLDEVKKVISHLPPLKDFSISGGEPFLRKDLVELCIAFNKLGPEELWMPTNGLMTDKIIKTTEEILSKVDYKVTLAVSLEGKKKMHNKVRGHFDKTFETLKRFRVLREKNPNFDFKVNTVITKDNVGELEEFSNWVYHNVKPGYHSYELVRDDKCSVSDKLPPLEELKKLKEIFINNSKRYNFGHKGLRARLATSLEETLFDYYLSIIKNKKALPCLAGKLTAVLYPNGDVSVCELLPPIGNVRDYDYNVPKMLENAKIPDKCWCTHTCFQIMNVKYSFRGWLKWLGKTLGMN